MQKFKVNRYQIKTSRKAVGEQAVRLVLLSDLHGNCYGAENQILLEEIERLRPDLIVMAGDMITAGTAQIPGGVVTLMKELGEQYPVYYGNGNHETYMKEGEESEYRKAYQNYKELLAACHIHILENERARFPIRGMDITLFGLEIGQEYYGRFCYRRLREEEVRTLLGKPDEDSFNLLIAHNPMGFEAYAKWGADLVLSGHLHGGFMRLPLVGGIISPQMHVFPKYDKGLYRRGKTSLVVSAGIGNHFPPPRIFNPREMVVIDLEGV